MGYVKGEYGDRAATIDVLERLKTAAVLGLEDLTSGADDVAGMVQTAVEEFEAEAEETTPDLAILAGYLQAIIERPSLVIVKTLDDRFDAYSDLVTEFATLLDDISTDVSGFNRALCVELAMSSVLNGLAVVVTTAQPETRSQAIVTAENLLTLFRTIVLELDEAQEAFEGRPINARYFSQTQTYTIALNLVIACVRYLLTSAYDLKVEKRFTLREPTAPVMIAIREYSNLSIAAAFDLFIKANDLTNIELLILEAGREVVVYV